MPKTFKVVASKKWRNSNFSLISGRKKGMFRKLKSKVNKLYNQREIKELTAFPQNTWTNVTSTGTALTGIQAIAVGNDFKDRVGRQITPTSLKLDFYVRGPATAVVGPPMPFRIIVIQDRGNNGSTPSIGNILEGWSVAANQQDTYLSGYNDDYVVCGKSTKNNPIKVLADIRGMLAPYQNGNGQSFKRIPISISGSKLKPIMYDGALATSNKGGSIYAYFYGGTDAVTATNNCQFTVRHTLRFVDD